MDIVHAHTISLGVPVPLIHDLLARGVPAATILAPAESLLAEYRASRGYACPWGDIMEVRDGSSLVWQFVPVELWETTERIRPPGHTAVELIPHLQPMLVATWRDQLPEELLLIGCHPRSRRPPHVLFGLLLAERTREQRMRRWLRLTFLPRVLPKAMAACRARIVDLSGESLGARKAPAERGDM